MSASIAADAKRSAPGPCGRPVLGSVREFTRDPLAFLTNVSRTYGDVARFRLGNRTLYLVSHPEGVRHVLQDNNHNYDKGGFQIEIMRRFVGNGLIVSDGDFWLRQRRLMQPLFHQRMIAHFATDIVELTARRIAQWGDGATLDVAAEMSDLTMDIVVHILFSTQVAADRAELGAALVAAAGEVSYRFENPLYPPLWVPLPRNRRALRALDTIEPVILGMIDQRRWLLASVPQAEWPADLLTLLLTARDEGTGEAMTARQVRDEVLTLFVAGHETTSVALMWTWVLLAENPAVEGRLHAEIDSALSRSLPTLGDLVALPYTRQVLDETLRLYPPAWVTNRRAVADDEIQGYRIPAGSTVLISPYVVHRRADLWEKPDAFDPARFGAAAAGCPKFAYFPFGGGPHLCIGRGLALMEAQLILATVAQRWRLTLAPGAAVEPKPLVTLRPRDALLMTGHRR